MLGRENTAGFRPVVPSKYLLAVAYLVSGADTGIKEERGQQLSSSL